jgi:DedD protein
MKKQDSLDDLIINENLGSNKNSNTKNILTMIGLVLAVLIGAILLTKMILEEPQKPKIPAEENLTNTALIQADANESNMSDINDSTIQTPDTTTSINDEINTTSAAAQDDELNDAAPSIAMPSAPEAVKKAAPKPIVTKTLPAKNKVDTKATEKIETKPAKKDLNKTEIKPATAVVQPSKTKVTEAPKTTTEPLVKNENVKKEQTANGETYYAQVGAFSNKPNDEFISIIKKNGYNYKVVSGQNGSSKILIGPYQGKAQADAALSKIRDRINKSAFLVK